MFKKRIIIGGLAVTWTLPARFWNKVKKLGENDCWLWMGATRHGGYGTIGIGGKRGKAKMLGAHQVSYLMHIGKIPKGLSVCHSCDKTSCVNPRHLWLGTHQENIADMVKKGRKNQQYGAKNPNRKLTQLQVNQIRKILPNAMPNSCATYAAQIGVHKDTISRAARGISWK
jgi:hypothetical protein